MFFSFRERDAEGPDHIRQVCHWKEFEQPLLELVGGVKERPQHSEYQRNLNAEMDVALSRKDRVEAAGEPSTLGAFVRYIGAPFSTFSAFQN